MYGEMTFSICEAVWNGIVLNYFPFQQLFISVWSLERGLCRYACAVESVCLPVLVPLCVPVLIRRVKNIQKKQT